MGQLRLAAGFSDARVSGQFPFSQSHSAHDYAAHLFGPRRDPQVGLPLALASRDRHGVLKHGAPRGRSRKPEYTQYETDTLHGVFFPIGEWVSSVSK